MLYRSTVVQYRFTDDIQKKKCSTTNSISKPEIHTNSRHTTLTRLLTEHFY